MRNVVLGTAGHVDHGKTSLIRALTGIDTDRLKDEKKRGITIELGFAWLDLPCGFRLGIVDVPGHERFVKNMVAGASGIDLVAFIVAADEGIMPQTREHFEVCRLLGVKHGLIIITKIDAVEADLLELVEEDVRDYFSGSFLEEAPLLFVSSITGQGIEGVKQTLDNLVKNWKFRQASGPFRLAVDRIFNLKGFGAVVTGTSISGRITTGSEVEVFPKGITGKIRSIQIHGESVNSVEAGNRTAISLQGLDKEQVSRGDFIATPGCLKPSFMWDGSFTYLSSNRKKFKNRTRVRVHLGTTEIMGRIVLLNEDELLPGQEADVQIMLESKYGAWPGDYYVARSYSPVTTIGGGTVFNGSPLRRRRFREINTRVFDLYRNGAPEELVLHHIEESGWYGITEKDLSVKMGVFGRQFQKLVEKPVSSRRAVLVDFDQRLLVAGEVFQKICSIIMQRLEEYHKDNPLKLGISKEALRNKVYRGLKAKLFKSCLNDLVKKGNVVLEEGVVRKAEHKVLLKVDEENLREELRKFLDNAGLRAPTLKEIYGNFPESSQEKIREVLDLLVKEKKASKVGEDLYFYSIHLQELQKKLVSFLNEEGDIDAPRFKKLTGLTRKFSIPLLEYYDRIKLTLRVGDKRVLRKK